MNDKKIQIRNSTVDFLVFTKDAAEDSIEVRVQDNDVWLTQKAIAQLFDVERSVITKHLKNIFEGGELDENAVCAKFAHTAGDGKTYRYKFYALSAIVAVGYRVNSQRATQFRQWATKVLDNPVSEPINYAVRNAVLDLTQFKDYAEVASWFHPAAVEPYTYKGKTYALPETFTFPMFFYRTDIFEELGLKEPESWDDIIEMIPDLQKKNLSMAFPKDINGYALLLYQNGGDLYINEGEKTNLKSNEALNSFVEFTEMFTLYDLPITYDFPNRFRSGEMPCGIQDYTMYNQLTVFAPEIKGLWKFIPVPGKKKADGTTENISVGTGMGDMILAGSRNPDLSWEFLKWWMSADVQSAFAKEMETILGPAAKQPTANMEALTKMTWSSAESRSLQQQLEHVRAVPEVPGGYYLTRVITFALNRVYNGSGTQNMAENPVEVLSEYVPELNDELRRKREEFGVK